MELDHENLDLVRVTDEDGNSMRVQQIHKGRFIPLDFAASGTERMRETVLRDDDVLLVSYPRSGCHWLWENLRFIMDGEIKHDSIEKDDLMMDAHEFGRFDNFPSPRLLNNHTSFDDQPSNLLQGKTKVIFLYRNPKDVVVSFYHLFKSSRKNPYDGRFSAFMKLFVQGKVPYNFLEFMDSWQQGLRDNPQIPCLCVSYEDLHRQPLAERRRIATFLGKKQDDDFLNDVAEATTIDKMRESKGGNTIGRTGEPFLYRKGKIGNWKHHFSVYDNEIFDEWLKENMAYFKMFDFVYE